MSQAIQRASELALDETTVTALRAELKTTADEVVQAIIDEVPPYANALSGHMGASVWPPSCTTTPATGPASDSACTISSTSSRVSG
ncbi:hypothetical protein AB0957_34945, partial [Streptomyces zhihengii]